jgi:hypothetical protein
MCTFIVDVDEMRHLVDGNALFRFGGVDRTTSDGATVRVSNGSLPTVV